VINNELPEGFIKWEGRRPFQGMALLRPLFRNGMISKDVFPAHKWHGVWRKGNLRNYDFDIVAVKVEEA